MTIVGRHPEHKLTHLARQKDMSLSDFAKKMRTPYSTVVNWTRTGVPKNRIAKVAKVLEVSVEQVPTDVEVVSPIRASRSVKKRAQTPKERLQYLENQYAMKCDRLNKAAQKLHENFLKERTNLMEELRSEIEEMREIMNTPVTQKEIVIQPRE